MTSTVKYHRDARIGPVPRWVSSPDFMEAVVIDITRDELCGGIPR